MAEKIIMIALSPTMNEGQIVSWIKKEGEFIENGEILCEVETDKAIMEYESPNEGTLLKILKKEGEKAFVGEVIAIIGKKNENISETLKTLDVKNINTKEKTLINVESNVESKNLNEPEKSENNSKQIYSSPLARNLAHKNNLNLELIKGTGPKNRIIKRDIENVLQNKNTSTQMIIKDSFIENLEKDQLIELSQKRKIIANRLSESKYSSPHYYLTLSIKMDDLLTARKKLNDSLKNRIGLNSFLIKYLSEALKKYPMINAGFENNKIRIFSSIDIGIAVAQDDGLITPIIRNCKSKGIIQIEKELKILIDKAKSGKIKPDEFTKASFTISNLGSFGIEEFTAIINPPGAAILAIGTIKKEPIVGINNQIEIQSLMKVTLSCDHRIIDGAYGANFLNEFKLIIENPIRILF